MGLFRFPGAPPPLVFPAGTPPKFNPNHFAAKGMSPGHGHTSASNDQKLEAVGAIDNLLDLAA